MVAIILYESGRYELLDDHKGGDIVQRFERSETEYITRRFPLLVDPLSEVVIYIEDPKREKRQNAAVVDAETMRRMFQHIFRE